MLTFGAVSRRKLRSKEYGALMHNRTPTALITGASGGIGYELAKLFAHDHHNLVLVARSGPKLTQFADELERQFGISAKPVALDLIEAAAPQFLFDQLRRQSIAVDILVNNAGYAKYGEFLEVPLEEHLGQIQLNVSALTVLTKLFLPPMLEKRAGRIMNVASTAGFQAGPLMAVYYATKGYVILFSEALANELHKSGVTVTCLCPSATETGFAKRTGNERTRLFASLRPMGAKTVARAGYRGLMKGKTLVIPGMRNWLTVESVRLTPRKMVTAVSRWVSETVE
jgi:short-subunit dehydrogenase